jgi:DNA (cytosine-5)-methyltransferase 1
MKHASFFSGVGGLDLGFHRAGITTVSVSEIDPYASSVLAERFPDALNLGNILEVKPNDIPDADIWSGGFPCQDLSAAGLRKGFAAGTRSSLAFRFLDLVEQRRPNWLVLENVPGLLTSNRGADFARLLSEMVELGYSVSWRVLDAQHFGVPQRRRRVFIVGNLGADRAAEVLLECKGCERHPAPSRTQREGAASGATSGAGISGEPISQEREWNATAHSDRNGTTDGISGRLDDQPLVATATAFGQYEMTSIAGTLRAKGGDAGGGSETILSFPSRFGSNASVSIDQAQSMAHSAGAPAILRIPEQQQSAFSDGALLPQGIDSHRYRCCGNGVVAPVAEWIGRRIRLVEQQYQEGGK